MVQRVMRTGVAILTIFAGSVAGSASGFAGNTSKSINSVSPAAYQSFRADVAAISTMRLDRAKNVEKARNLLAGYDEVALSRGLVAEYAAIASKTKSFKKGVRKAARKHGGEKRFVSALQANPNVVLQVRTWEAAAKSVANVAAQDTSKMAALAHRLNEVAYGRTAQEASLSRAGGITSSTGKPNVKAPSTLMVRILALGALMELEGVSTVSAKPKLSAFTADAHHDQCLRWARLNINQCLAAAGTNEETAYCLSTQALDEREKCWTSLTGAS